MSITSVSNHEKQRLQGLFSHVADVTVEGEVPDVPALIGEVSEKVGYPPAGYGIYGRFLAVETAPGKYRVRWQTGTSCD